MVSAYRAPCALLLVVVLNTAGCRFMPRAGGAAVTDLKELERITRLQFPPGTQLLEARGHFTLDYFVQAKLRMPRAALQPFLWGSLVTSVTAGYEGQPTLSLSRSERPAFVLAQGLRHADWRPEQVRSFLAAQAACLSQMRGAHLLADLGDPTTVTVYLACWQN